MIEPSIELHNVSYQYPNAESPSLRQIAFRVNPGELVMVMGPTGAGKTTLALCCNGLIPQLLGGRFTGTVTVAGKDIRNIRVQALAPHIGLVLQDSETQIFGNTVAEDTAFGLCNLLVPAAQIDERVLESLGRVRLRHCQNRNTAELSGGEKQRLALAGVLALQPEILVLDEPASELDPLGRTEIYQTITRLRRENGVSILLIEHSAETILDQADSLVVLDQGGIVWQGPPVSLFRNIPLLEEFGIKPLPVSRIAWAFYQKGWLRETEIPLRLPETAALVRQLLHKYGTGRFPESDRGFVPSPAPNLPPDGTAVVQIRDLCYSYPHSDVLGLREINLTVYRGEFIALIGPNGAGKTTLAKHLNGLLQPTGGTVIINGMDTRRHTTAQLAQTVGFVFQNPDHQIFTTSIDQELRFGLQNVFHEGRPLPEAEVEARIVEALRWVGLESSRTVHPFTLGKGERQLVALASILVLKPEILVIDEPTTGLDWTGTKNIMKIIQNLHQNGTTLIMITHDMELVAEYAQRVILLKDGAVLRDGPTREVLGDSTVLEQASVIPPQTVRLSQSLRDVGLTETLLTEPEFIAAVLQATEGLSCR